MSHAQIRVRVHRIRRGKYSQSKSIEKSTDAIFVLLPGARDSEISEWNRMGWGRKRGRIEERTGIHWFRELRENSACRALCNATADDCGESASRNVLFCISWAFDDMRMCASEEHCAAASKLQPKLSLNAWEWKFIKCWRMKCWLKAQVKRSHSNCTSCAAALDCVFMHLHLCASLCSGTEWNATRERKVFTSCRRCTDWNTLIYS